jgi:uncharacterized protein YcbK (DUF882 family)
LDAGTVREFVKSFRPTIDVANQGIEDRVLRTIPIREKLREHDDGSSRAAVQHGWYGGLLVRRPALADTGFPSHRWVKIVFVHTGERFNNLYFSDGTYIMPAVQQFSWTRHDYRAGQWKWIHPWLMDLVFVLHWRYNKDEIKILSGYRTPETNAQLEGAALNSQHLRAMALDIHISDVDKRGRGP